MTSTATKFKSSTTDTAKLAFNAQLVMHDEKQKQLKQSRRFGTLSIETHTQSVKFRYPKTNPMFHRSFKQPWKCILGKQVMEIYASNRVHSFRCRIVSKDEVEQVVDALCSIGVDIVDVDPEKYLFTDDTTIKSNEEADMAAQLLQLKNDLSNSTHKDSLLSILAAHCESGQLDNDIATISRCFFGPLD